MPQVKFPQIEPVTSTIMLINKPIGEIALAIVKEVGDLKTNPIMLLTPIKKNNIKESHAAGT